MTRRTTVRCAGVLGVLLATGLALAAVWTPASLAAERIAAIVNKTVILSSEVDEQTRQAAARYGVNPADSVNTAKLRREVLNQLIEKEVILAEATRLGVTVSPKDVTEGVDQEIGALKERVGGEEQFRKALAQENTTEPALRKKYEPEVREQLMIMRTIGREVQSKTQVTDAEVRAYYNANRDSIGKRPELLRLAHILIAFEPDSMQAKRARQRADSIRTAINKGSSFVTLAQRFSDDPSGKRGGDLGVFARGEMVAEFEDVAFSLKPKEISAPVRTRFGYHLIEVLERHAASDSLPERIHARHIMIATKPTPADEDRARVKALALRDSLLHGASFAAIAKRYSMDVATRDSAGALGEVPVPSLAPNMREVLTALREGEVSTPFKRDSGYHIFKVMGRVPETDYKYEEIKEDLRRMAQNKKLEDAYKRWYERIKKTVNVEIKE